MRHPSSNLAQVPAQERILPWAQLQAHAATAGPNRTQRASAKTPRTLVSRLTARTLLKRNPLRRKPETGGVTIATQSMLKAGFLMALNTAGTTLPMQKAEKARVEAKRAEKVQKGKAVTARAKAVMDEARTTRESRTSQLVTPPPAPPAIGHDLLTRLRLRRPQLLLWSNSPAPSTPIIGNGMTMHL